MAHLLQKLFSLSEKLCLQMRLIERNSDLVVHHDTPGYLKKVVMTTGGGTVVFISQSCDNL